MNAELKISGTGTIQVIEKKQDEVDNGNMYTGDNERR